MLQSSPDAPTPRMRQNYLSEQVFEWAGVGVAHIRATIFYENVAALVRQSLPAQGAIRLPWGGENTVLPLVAGEDVARVAVGLLTGPQPAAGSIVRMIGATMSLKEIVATFASVLARKVNGAGKRPRATTIRTRSSISPRSGARSAAPRSIRKIPTLPSRIRSKRSAAPGRRRSRPSCEKRRASCWRNRLNVTPKALRPIAAAPQPAIRLAG